MSAGAFGYSKYDGDDGTSHTIEVQPETVSLWTALGWSLPGAAAVKPRAIVSGSRKTKGILHTRMLTIKSPTPPTGYKADSPISIPLPDLTTYNSIPMVGQPLGQPYLGVSTWVVVSKSPEVDRS